MAWCTVTDFRQRAKQATDANNWDSTRIGQVITRAENVLRAFFVPRYGVEEVQGWDSTTPPLITDICANQAAVYFHMDQYGEAQLKEGTPGKALQDSVDKMLEELETGDKALLNSSGEKIEKCDDWLLRIGSTTEGREPTFTTREKVQDSTLRGTLDGF